VTVHAARGDRLVIRSPQEVRHADGSPPYVVRWSDTGHEGLVFPGPDAFIQHLEHERDEQGPS
jgi:Domain of unknown function (DUF1918)